MEDAERGANATITVDLEKQEITGPDGGAIHFDIDPFRKHCLLEGLDDIGKEAGGGIPLALKRWKICFWKRLTTCVSMAQGTEEHVKRHGT